MSQFAAELEIAWTKIGSVLPSVFTTQDYVEALKLHASDTWDSITERHGPGGKGSGRFYSPANIIFNFLKRKSDDLTIFRRQFVAASPSWGSPVVAEWEFAARNSSIPPDDFDLEFIEGRQLFRSHLQRERAVALRFSALKSREVAGLSCDCCGRAELKWDIRLQRAMFEVHHKQPLAGGARRTRLTDIDLLCATCHRLIHQAMILRGGNVTVNELAAQLAFSSNGSR